jgi:hypothetical protein
MKGKKVPKSKEYLHQDIDGKKEPKILSTTRYLELSTQALTWAIYVCV